MTDAKLRDEAIANQVFQRDLLKWKLVLCGGGFAFGFGFTGADTPFAYLSLCAVPISAVYCDLLISDADMRIATKAYFLRDKDDDSLLGDYERFIGSSKVSSTRWWEFRSIAVVWSSVIMSGLVAVVGILGFFLQPMFTVPASVILLVAGVAGIVVSFLIRKKTHTIRDAMVENLSK